MKPKARKQRTPDRTGGDSAILTSKLHPPRLTPELLWRERLTALLERGRQRPLTLISAPAGYGKSTLASRWLQDSSSRSAWLSLDEADNDAHVFVDYMVAAVKSAVPTLQFETATPRTPRIPDMASLARSFIHDLQQLEEPLILALDDVQTIREQSIFDFLGELLQHLPPSVHLVLISRHDPPLPIASLRARGLVTEIRSQDLRFSLDETRELLKSILDREISDDAAAHWTRQTEGWVTALRLAALSLRHRGRDDSLTVRFAGGSRYLRDYLLAEVLSRLPPDYQTQLLEAAILDKFCAPLCEAIWKVELAQGSRGLSGEQFIDWLEQEDLFLIPLDDQHIWFRFHELFREMLMDMRNSTVKPSQVAELRMHASRWLAENHRVEEALKYALEAGEVQAAVQMVEQNHYRLMDEEQWPRLERWLKMLPEDAVKRSPVLISAQVHQAVFEGRDPDIISSLQFAEQLLATLSPGTPRYKTLRSELAVVYAVSDVVEGHPAEALGRLEGVLTQLPNQALHIRTLAIGVRAIALQMQGDVRGAAALIGKQLAARDWPAGCQAKLLHYLCVVFFHEGDLTGVMKTARDGLQIAEKVAVPATIGGCRHYLGIAHYLRNQLAEAESILGKLLTDWEGAPPLDLIHGGLALALTYEGQGRADEAAGLLDRMQVQSAAFAHSHAAAFVKAFRVELALREGRLAEARLLGRSADFEGRLPVWYYYAPRMTPIRLLLAEGTADNLAAASSALAVLEACVRNINRRPVLLEVLALSALAQRASGNVPAAFHHLREALEIGEAGGFIRSFTDMGSPMAELLLEFRGQTVRREHGAYLQRLLAAFREMQVPHGKPLRSELDEPLTEREVEVLSLLARRLRNKEIAGRLYVSPRTVKRHTLNIYRKFNVNSREQAVARAREIGILVSEAHPSQGR